MDVKDMKLIYYTKGGRLVSLKVELGFFMFGDYINFIENRMNQSVQKRALVSDNIVNMNTPGYKSRHLETKGENFSDLFPLKTTTSKTHQDKHLPLGEGDKSSYRIVEDVTNEARPDGNNVDLSSEMIEMLKNNTAYTRAVQAINKEFAFYKIAMGN